MRFFFFCFLLASPCFAKEGAPLRELSLLSEENRCWLQEQEGPVQARSFEELSLLFKKTKELSKQISKPTLVAARPENSDKNAYATILPFDETRTLRDRTAFYINANDVFTPRQRYIAAQCPLPAGLADFWRAVLETQTPTIVALLMPQDAHGRHCQYWSKEALPITIDGWTVSLSGQEEVLAESKTAPEQKIVQRTIVASKKHEARELCHLHYENWPDFGAPDPALFSAFLFLVDELHPWDERPLFVHCAAGAGRTGVFLAAHSLRKELLAGAPTVNIPERLFSLRVQRPKTISTPKQCEAVYLALLAPLSLPHLIAKQHKKEPEQAG